MRQKQVKFATMDGMASPLPQSAAALIRLAPWRRERVLEGEILDGLPAEVARENLLDMARVNRWFGGFRLLRAGIRQVAGDREGLRILDVAAGGGATGRWLQRALPGAQVTSSDLRADLLALGSGARCGADALELPFRDGAFDVVVSSFFLHHLEEAAVGPAVREMLRVSRMGVAVVDLARHPLAYRFLHWSHPLFRWNWITLVDGPRSVQAAFTRQELSALVAREGLPGADVRMQHPWFRLLVTIPKQARSR